MFYRKWVKWTVFAGLCAWVIPAALPAQAQTLIHEYLEGKRPFPGPKAAYTGKPFTLRFSSPIPPQSATMPVFKASAELLTKVTQGKIVVKQFHAGTLHGYGGGFKAVRGGVSDFATCFVQAEKTMPLSNAWYLPFVAPGNPAVATRIHAELAPKYFKGEYENLGVYMTGIMETGRPMNLLSRVPIRRLEELKGKKVGIDAPSNAPIVKALGGVPVVLGYGALYIALQRGTVDSMLWIDPAFIPFKLYEVAKFRTVVEIAGSTIDTCISKKFFDALPRDLKQILYIWAQLMTQAISQIATIEQPDLSIYDKNGVKTTVLPPAEKEHWKAKVKPVIDHYLKRNKGKAAAIKQLLADIEKLKAKYANATPDQITELTADQPVQGMIKF